MAAMGRQEPVMNDCCPVGDWVAGKPTLAIGSTRCIAEVGFRLIADLHGAPKRSLTFELGSTALIAPIGLSLRRGSRRCR
jgi:hypothetical protein